MLGQLVHRSPAPRRGGVTQDLEACRAKSFKTFLTASNPSATLTLSGIVVHIGFKGSHRRHPIKGTNERIDSDAKQENR